VLESKMMSSLGSIAWIGHIWLTALMTLVAGVPHFACRCPDGQVKPFCMGTPSSKSRCCCRGTCCSPIEGGTCCCAAQSRTAGPEVGHSNCTKTLAPSVLLTVGHGRTTIAKPLTAGALVAAQAASVVSLTTMARARSAWQAHQIAPPSDLITVLQRLVI
jgi:hypothetical protein